MRTGHCARWCFDGDFTKLHTLTAVRLGFADTVQV